MADRFLLVLTTLPDEPSAAAMARRLLEAGIAACVTIGGPVTSLYHWQGKIETSREWTLTIKTNAERLAEVESVLRQHHPYELPEIIAVPFAGGYAPYLDWIAASTAPRGSNG